MRTYVNNDLLKRSLQYLGYTVDHVMNITDVGHLTGDDDIGEDKLEKGAKSSGKTVWEVAQFYTDSFVETMRRLNVIPSDHFVKATDHIQEMVDLITQLEKKGYTYITKEAIYFDISKFSDYGKLSKQKVEDKIQRAREEVQVDPDKKHPADFALWFFKQGRFADHAMHWDSPWGDGFPGWHIECSAMSMRYLGETLDIHTGGIDHIPVHHENEIAQSEAATDKQFVKYWFHNAFVLVDGIKMSKSLKNFYTLKDTDQHSIDPLALRYLFLQTHYRQQMNFTWDSATSAQNGLRNVRDQVRLLKTQTDRVELSEDKMRQVEEYQRQFRSAIENDLQMPQAVAVMWSMLKSNIPSRDKLDLLFTFDQVFGLDLQKVEEKKEDEEIPTEIQELIKKRGELKLRKEFEKADDIRKQIEDQGYTVIDTSEGSSVKKI